MTRPAVSKRDAVPACEATPTPAGLCVASSSVRPFDSQQPHVTATTPTPIERLAHLPTGAEVFAVAAYAALDCVVAVEAVISRTPNPMHPRGDVPALVALGLTWPEERQRLRHALENVVHAVKGDAGRHLQRLQRYLAHLDAKTLSEEDAAAMLNALLADDGSERSVASPSPPVRRMRDLSTLLDAYDALAAMPILPPRELGAKDIAVVTAASTAAGSAAAGSTFAATKVLVAPKALALCIAFPAAAFVIAGGCTATWALSRRRAAALETAAAKAATQRRAEELHAAMVELQRLPPLPRETGAAEAHRDLVVLSAAGDDDGGGLDVRSRLTEFVRSLQSLIAQLGGDGFDATAKTRYGSPLLRAT